MDTLTGLANRALFTTTLSRTLVHRAGTETAVLFVDLDDFKDVNDTFGHSAGDELLREVASRLTAATRTGDLCARLGGDEFAVLLPHTGAEQARDIARGIVDALGGPIRLTEGAAQVGASVGLAVDRGDSTPEQLVQRADIAMYAAKAAGKGRVQVFTSGLLQDDASRGSLYLRPAPADELATWLRGRPPTTTTPDEVVVSFTRRKASGRT
jgi:diguanylate cyclase (GGDEF)-like protein